MIRFKTISLKKGIAIVILALVVITGLVASRRSVKGSNDFDTFYAAGKAVLTGEGIYYIGEYYQEKEGSPFLYPPFAALLFALFALLPLPVAAFLWNAFTIAVFAGVLWLTYGFLGTPLKIREAWRVTPLWTRLLFLVWVTVLLLDNLSMSQINVLVLGVVLLALYFSQKSRPFLSGFVLAAAILLKVTPVFFLIYFAIQRSWKTLVGSFIALIFMTLVLPTLIFGWEANRIYHRQWIGRALKPMMADFLNKIQKEDIHPRKKSLEALQYVHLGNLLTEKNQSLEGTVSRFFLKDRDYLAEHGSYPLVAAIPYKGLPVVGGGLTLPELQQTNRILKACFILGLALLLALPKTSSAAPMDYSLVLLTMTLLAPWVRSHQFVGWVFPLATALYAAASASSFPKAFASTLRFGMALSAVFYILQSVPYGKAAGFGTFANLTLWGAFAFAILLDYKNSRANRRRKDDSEIRNPAI